MKKIAVIVAGGSGTRMGANIAKQFLLLNGKSVLWHSIKAFTESFPDIEMIIVLPEGSKNQGESIIEEFKSKYSIQTVVGGDTRYQSVQNGLKCIHGKAIIFVHDSVRCLVTPTLIRNCYNQALILGSAIPAIDATDSMRILCSDSNENKILPREFVKIIQTPQVFDSEILLSAYQQKYQTSFTDEASVVETLPCSIHLIQGEPFNIKITHPIDLIIAEKILNQRNEVL